MTALAPLLAALLIVAVLHRHAPRPRRAMAPTPRRSVAVGARSSRWLAVAVAAVSGFVVGGIVLSLVAAGVVAAAGPVSARRRRSREQKAVAGAVPDLVDLFLVSASAGLPVAGSLARVAPRAPAALVPAVAGAQDRFRRGQPLQVCLGELGDDLGPAGAPLTDALRQAASAGVPLVPLLEGVAATARDQRRRRAQEVARRLPVTMLLPLVACILPAAILLAVVPVLLVSVASLRP